MNGTVRSAVVGGLAGRETLDPVAEGGIDLAFAEFLPERRNRLFRAERLRMPYRARHLREELGRESDGVVEAEIVARKADMLLDDHAARGDRQGRDEHRVEGVVGHSDGYAEQLAQAAQKAEVVVRGRSGIGGDAMEERDGRAGKATEGPVNVG